jgi:glutamate synthase domain-containing protein 2
MRKQFFIGSLLASALIFGGFFLLPPIYLPIHITLSVFVGILILIGLADTLQTHQTIRRNFPVIGHFRYILESVRPEIQQYFVERNTDGMPFSREQRSVIYQRAKNQLDTLPFGTQRDTDQNGYEWVGHSIDAKHVDPSSLRISVGGPDCLQPYLSSIFNISAMSYGALSKNAVLALNGGAQEGGFSHNTGEGSISQYHLKNEGDLVWQIGTGYFGCRDNKGAFDEKKFREKALLKNVKMIEIKLSQGAKPGHGGILPKAKITPEIAEIRAVGMDRDVISPPSHSAFSTPIELLQFIKKLRELSHGKPIGFKLCIGKRREFMAICKAMVETKIMPDFITVDGGEGGTGAAPLEFSNHVGGPGIDGLIFVHNCLLGFDLRQHIRVIASGKVTTGFGIIKRLALGADITNSARGMMMALGCIQALRCNSNVCPAGVATQDPSLVAGLVVGDKRKRVAAFHKNTLISTAELIGAMGLTNTAQLRPWHIFVRVGTSQNKNYHQLFEYVKAGAFLRGEIADSYKYSFETSRPDSFSSEAIPVELSLQQGAIG